MTSRYMHTRSPQVVKMIENTNPPTFLAEAIESLMHYEIKHLEAKMSRYDPHALEFLQSQVSKCKRNLRNVTSCPGCQGNAGACPEHGQPGDFMDILVADENLAIESSTGEVRYEWHRYGIEIVAYNEI